MKDGVKALVNGKMKSLGVADEDPQKKAYSYQGMADKNGENNSTIPSQPHQSTETTRIWTPNGAILLDRDGKRVNEEGEIIDESLIAATTVSLLPLDVDENGHSVFDFINQYSDERQISNKSQDASAIYPTHSEASSSPASSLTLQGMAEEALLTDKLTPGAIAQELDNMMHGLDDEDDNINQQAFMQIDENL